MATIYKRRRRRPIPEGAEILSRNGQQFAVWTDRKTGRRQRAPLSDDGEAIIVQADCYTIEWFDHEGKRRRKGTRIADKDAAQQLANKLETGAMQRREGLIDAAQERFAQEGRKTIRQHLSDFRDSLAAKGNSPKHVGMTYKRALCILEACGAESLSDLTASAVEAAVADVRTAGHSLRTCNGYLRAVKQFSRWLWRDGRTAGDSLAHLKSYNAKTDKRLVRRDLLADELTRLIQAAEHGPAVSGMAGPNRAMLYATAAGTGFRAGELRSLTWASFDLEADQPTITVGAAYSKRRREDVQPICQDLADGLRGWLAGRPEGEPVFNIPEKTAKMLRSDLGTAGIPEVDTEGRVIDFHALRHTYITMLGKSGAPLKVVQELARHSVPTLTMGYTHVRLHDQRAALDALPSMTPGGRQAESDWQVLRATGTDDARAEGRNSGGERPPAGERWAHQGQQLGRAKK